MRKIVAGAFMTLACLSETVAVPNTKIEARCPNILLFWPSSPGQSFLVQFKTNIANEIPWVTITNYLLAPSGTNQTIFLHPDQIPCPSTNYVSGGGGGGGLPPSPAFATIASQPAVPLAMRADGTGTPVPLVLYPPGFDLSGLIIFDPSSDEWISGNGYEIQPAVMNGPQPLDGGTYGPLDAGGGADNMGFYRVIDVTPIARADAFAVEQYSAANQLDILKNDTDPNDDRFQIAALIAAGHGDIQYTLDGATFQYTPDPDFCGIDAFGYTITNWHGSYATTTITVFVNQSGNQQPSAADSYFTLATNVYVATFNALTNGSDPDNDSLTLVSVSSPRLGSVTTNSSGDITYTRNASFFGTDTFTYAVTDGKGGYALATVTIAQVDSDGDGMPDEWEMNNGIDPWTDDSALDPDNDGLPNLAEFRLQISPQKPDSPLELGLENGTSLGGFAQIPLPNLRSTISPLPIVLFVNGTQAEKAFLSRGPDGTWSLNWDTAFMPNGNYTIKAAFEYNPDISSTSGILFGTAKSVQVSNLITFDQLTSVFSDFVVIQGTLSVQNASFLLQLYDENDQPLVYGNFSTTNGQFQIGWDLTDGNGNQISFSSIHARFDVTTSGGLSGPQPRDAGTTSVWEWFLKGRTPGPGNTFVSAWGWDTYTYSFNNKTEQMMLDGVLNILGNPANPNAYYLAPNANVPYATAFRFDNTADKAILLNALRQNQNFFWIGHGSYNGILGNKNRADVGPNDIEDILQNLAYKSRPNHPKEDKHQYRLVILNGCETYSSLWAGVFGIPFSSQTSTNIALDYQYTGQMPRAFVGWNDVIRLPFGWDPTGIGHAQYGLALGELTSKWMAGYPLDFCLDFFSDMALSYGYTGNDSWSISGCVDLTRWW